MDVRKYGKANSRQIVSSISGSMSAFLFSERDLGSVTVRHSSIGGQPNFAALNKGRHLYSAGRLSRWALAHISSYGRPVISIYLSFIWSPYVIGQTIIFSSCSFFPSSFFCFPRLISAVGDWMFTILWHMVWP